MTENPKRPRAGRIMIFNETEDGKFLSLTESFASRKSAQEGLKKIGLAGKFTIAAVLWQGEVSVETKTVATLLTVGDKPAAKRTRKAKPITPEVQEAAAEVTQSTT